MFEYARNFYTGATRMLDVRQHFRQGGILGIEYHGRFVPLRVSHIGVDIKDLTEMIENEANREQITEFKEKIKNLTKQRN